MKHAIHAVAQFTTGFKSYKNHRFVCADRENSSFLYANRDRYQTWEQFTFIPVDQANQIYAIKSHLNNQYVSVLDDEILTPARTIIGTWEKFRLNIIDEHTFALQSLKNNRWVCVEDITIVRGSNPQVTVRLNNVLTATRDRIQTWEKFYFAT